MFVNSRRTQAVLIGGVLMALIAAYFGLRTRTPTDEATRFSSGPTSIARAPAPILRPAQDAEPSKDMATTSVDVAAAFQILRLCAQASRELAITQYLSNCEEYEGRPEFQALYAKCLNGWMNVPNRKAAAETALKNAGCGDTTDIDARFFEATRQAAKAGDADAQMCYLEGEFGTSGGQPLFTNAEVEEYRRVAPHYVDAALRRGDWRVVELMTKDSFHPGVEPIRNIPGIGKPEAIYKMRKLLRLGASGLYATMLNSELEGMIHPDLVPEAALSADVIERGNAWAQQTFNQYFSGRAGLTERPTVCMAPMGGFEKLPGSASP
jgi:hypothetical protein